MYIVVRHLLRITAIAWCIGWLTANLGIMWPDLDEMLVIAGALGAAGFIYGEVKRDRRLDALAIEYAERIKALEVIATPDISERVSKLEATAPFDVAERLARLEATATDDITIEGRLRALETWVERDERVEERVADLGERVRALEVMNDIGERVRVLEAQREQETNDSDTEPDSTPTE